MSHDAGTGAKSGFEMRPSLLRRLMPAAIILVIIIISSYYFNETNKPMQTGAVSGAALPSAIKIEKPSAITGQDSTVVVTIDTEVGRLRAEFYPDKAPAAVAELIALTRAGYYSTDTELEVRPGLGFVIAKLGGDAKKYVVSDEQTGLSSRRGSIAISSASVSSAYLNNLFFGFNPQPGLEQNYIIIGQVLDGLERFERIGPGMRHKVRKFNLVSDAGIEKRQSVAVLKEQN